MKKAFSLSLLSVLLLGSISCSSGGKTETDNKDSAAVSAPTPEPAPAATETTSEMTFKGYEEGDYPHFLFTEAGTNKEYDFRFLDCNNLGGTDILQKDDHAAFGYKANPGAVGKKFRITMEMKEVSDSDLQGEAFMTTGPCIKKIEEVK